MRRSLKTFELLIDEVSSTETGEVMLLLVVQ